MQVLFFVLYRRGRIPLTSFLLFTFPVTVSTATRLCVTATRFCTSERSFFLCRVSRHSINVTNNHKTKAAQSRNTFFYSPMTEGSLFAEFRRPVASEEKSGCSFCYPIARHWTINARIKVASGKRNELCRRAAMRKQPYRITELSFRACKPHTVQPH